MFRHWHQPIKISGHMVPVDQAGTIGPGPDCELEEQGHGMIVTKIKPRRCRQYGWGRR